MAMAAMTDPMIAPIETFGDEPASFASPIESCAKGAMAKFPGKVGKVGNSDGFQI